MLIFEAFCLYEHFSVVPIFYLLLGVLVMGFGIYTVRLILLILFYDGFCFI